MKTEFVNNITPEKLNEAGKIIRSGGLVAFPTETVYGLGGNAFDKDSAKAIFTAKGRPSDNPLIVHISKPEDAECFAYTNDAYYELSKHFMPGPLTVILKKKENIPDSVTGGLDSVAVRCPEHPTARALIDAAGVPIAAPSANISGAPSPTTAEHVLRDMNGKIEMIIDGGECRIGVESTVIRLEADGCTVLRPGEITPRELASVIGNVYVADAVIDPSAVGDKPQSPGMKYKHYAPKAKLILLSGSREAFADYVNSDKNKCAVLSYTEYLDDFDNAIVFDIGNECDASSQMHNLFRILRDTDDTDIETVYAHLPEKSNDFLALYNRIIRAAGCDVREI